MPVLRSFTERAVAEIAQAAAVALVSSVPGGLAFSGLAGGLSKELAESLLTKTTEVERKLDKLLREPLKAGLQLLRDAALNPRGTTEEIASRDALLDQAHTKLVTAAALVGDSREDSLLIAALDCIALAERTGRTAVAAEHLKQATAELEDLHRRLVDLQREAADWIEHVNALNRFLGRGNWEDWGGKPVGYSDQVALAKKQEKQAQKIAAEAQTAALRFEMLQKLVTLATASMNQFPGANKSASPQA